MKFIERKYKPGVKKNISQKQKSGEKLDHQ